MTLTDATTTWLDRNIGRLALALVAGTCICFAGLGYVQLQVRSQASQGSKARQRQMRTFPISNKVYTDAYRRGVISQSELQCFRGRDDRCPPTRPSP